MAFVTDSNRPQPLWQPPTACPTASGAVAEASSLLMHPWAGLRYPPLRRSTGRRNSVPTPTCTITNGIPSPGYTCARRRNRHPTPAHASTGRRDDLPPSVHTSTRLRDSFPTPAHTMRSAQYSCAWGWVGESVPSPSSRALLEGEGCNRGNSLAFGSAPRREADSQLISQLARPAVSQTETHRLGFFVSGRLGSKQWGGKISSGHAVVEW